MNNGGVFISLISIIIPIYNAEDYIETTIASVMNQSIGFDNLELILVDDNSSDNSREIMEKFCAKYDNIIPYYSNENHGFPGFGRNKGLELASSDYIMFLDNDDEYDINICKKLYETITKHDVDLVSCGRLVCDTISEIKDSYHYTGGKSFDDFIVFENDEILSFCSVTVWNKIFKKSIIDKYDLKFLENTSADDLAFSIDYHSKSKKIIHLNHYYGYKWYIRNESLSNDIKMEHMLEVLDAYDYIINGIIDENKLIESKELLKHMASILIVKSSYLGVSFSDYKNILIRIAQFEKKIKFDENFDDILLDFPNKLILSNKFSLAIFYLRFLKHIRKISFLRKINRKK